MKRSFNIFIALQMVLVSWMSIVSSFGYSMYQENLPKAQYIKQVKVRVGGDAPKEITLPYHFKHLKPRTPITVTAVVTPDEDDIIYVKTAYAPAKVYTNGVLIYELGKKETYPNFMMDPATEVYFVRPSAYNKEVEFKMEFFSPVSRNSMTVYPPIISTFKSMFAEFVGTYKVSFLFSVIQLTVGVFLAIVSFFMIFLKRESAGYSFGWVYFHLFRAYGDSGSVILRH